MRAPQTESQQHGRLTPAVPSPGDEGEPDGRFIKAAGPLPGDNALPGDNPLLADVPITAGDLRDPLREAALRAMI